MINPKSHAQSKRGKRYLSRRDYKYGGKIGGHSVLKDYVTIKQMQMLKKQSKAQQSNTLKIALSQSDQLWKDAGLKLPIEEAIGFELKDYKPYGNRPKQQEALAAALEFMHSEKFEGKPEFPQQEGITYYCLPPAVDASNRELRVMQRDFEYKQRTQHQKFLKEFLLGEDNTHGRADMRKWGNCYQIGSTRSFYKPWNNDRYVEAHNSFYQSKADIVGFGVQGGIRWNYGKTNYGEYVRPKAFTIFYKLRDEANWIEYGQFDGPNDFTSERTYNLKLKNVSRIKLVAKTSDMVTVSRAQLQGARRYCTFFIYGSFPDEEYEDHCKMKEKNELTKVFGNYHKPSETVIQFVSGINHKPKCFKQDYAAQISTWGTNPNPLRSWRLYHNGGWHDRKPPKPRVITNKQKKSTLILKAGCDYKRKKYGDLKISTFEA